MCYVHMIMCCVLVYMILIIHTSLPLVYLFVYNLHHKLLFGSTASKQDTKTINRTATLAIYLLKL